MYSWIVPAACSLCVATGVSAVFLVAPTVVDSNLPHAYAKLQSSPNLSAAVVWGICWLVVSILVGLIATRLSRDLGRRTRRQIGWRVGCIALCVGIVLTGVIVPAGTMSNAIADVTSPVPGGGPEVYAVALFYLGLLAIGVGLIVVACSWLLRQLPALPRRSQGT